MASEDDQIRELQTKLERLRGLKRSDTGTFFGVAVEALALAEKAEEIAEDAAELAARLKKEAGLE